jgi:RNA polymerase sigma-70 factor, ECF subfamily
MYTTSVSLLARLRQTVDQESWTRFVKLYTPLLYRWGRQVGLTDVDAADLVEDVLLTLIQKLPDFQYDPQGSFRGWLRTVALNKARENHRRRERATTIDNATLSRIATRAPQDVFEEHEYQQCLVRRALALMQNEFEPTTWQACWQCVVDDKLPATVARQLQISVNAVYLAKSRVLRRLHQELSGLLE